MSTGKHSMLDRMSADDIARFRQCVRETDSLRAAAAAYGCSLHAAVWTAEMLELSPTENHWVMRMHRRTEKKLIPKDEAYLARDAEVAEQLMNRIYGTAGQEATS
jgi:hypothetical protein